MKKAPLKRKTPLRSHSTLKKSPWKKHHSSTTRAKEFSLKVRQIVQERSQGMCERCGSEPAVHIHHAVFRSQQGTNELSNAIALGARCHEEAHTKRWVRDWCVDQAKRLAKRESVGSDDRTSPLKSDEALRQAHETIRRLRLQCQGCPGYAKGECPTCSIEREIQGIVTSTQRQQLERMRERHHPVLVAK